MKKIATIALICLSSWRCVAGDARAAVSIDNEVVIVASGDTIFATDHITVSGNPDSINVFFTVRSAPPKVARRGSGNGKFALGPVTLIPSPPYIDGDTATVSACPIAWKRGKSFSQVCGTKLYQRNDPPVVGQDSLVVSFQLWPDTITATLNDTIRFMTVATYGDGHTATWMRDYFTAHEAGVQIVWAGMGGKSDTSRIRVLVSTNEPAAFQPFAIYSGSVIPPYPRAKLPTGICSWCGYWM